MVKRNKKARQVIRQQVKSSKQGLTRARAEKMISRAATLEDLEPLARFSEHKNKHVKAKLEKKLTRQAA